MDMKVITRIDSNVYFEGSPQCLYKFYEDRDDIADNMLRPWKGPVNNALIHSVELVKMIEEIYIEAIVETEDGSEIHPDKALQSSKYESYIENCSVLEKVDLSMLN